MNSTLPESFKPLLWSYDFPKLDAVKDQQTVIINAINYGDLSHWSWLREFYGDEKVREVLSAVPVTEIKPRTRKLVSLIFSITNFNHALRGAH